MLLYHTTSWHYRLILWTWGKHFFEESEIDMQAYMALDSTKLEKLSWEEMPRKYHSKTVNFCPYCRALLGAVISAPFVYFWRLFPHKPKEPLTREGIRKSARRRTYLALGFGGGINIAIGIKNLVFGVGLSDYIAGIIQISIGLGFFLAYRFREPLGKGLIRLADWISTLRKPKVKVEKVKAPKKPSKLKQKLAEKHDLICPPVYFVDPLDQEKMR